MTTTATDWTTKWIRPKTTYPAGQRSWYDVETGEIAGSSYSDFLNYEVPTGYTLHVCSGLISSDYSCIQKCAMNFSPALLGNVYYDTLFALPLNPSGSYKIAAGSTLYVRVYNVDTAAHNFTVSLVGFEEAV